VVKSPLRPNIFEISLDAVRANTATIRALIGQDVSLFAALKANAYGFGLAEVAGALLESGVDGLALAELSDAIELREAGVKVPILLYPGVLASAYVAQAIEEYALFPTLLDGETARIFAESVRRELKVFIKIDVGLERLGVRPEAAVEFIQHVHGLGNLSAHGIYTHLHVIESADSEEYANWQFKRFLAVLQALDRLGCHIPIRMAASSAVIRMTQAMNLNAADPGHLLYGLAPQGPGMKVTVRPAFQSIKSRLIEVKTTSRPAWRRHAPFVVDKVTQLGIIPIGRADGMAALNCGYVLVHGQRARILTPPSLEHTRIDLSGITTAKVGDEVIVIGRQGRESITTSDVAAHQGIPEIALALEVRPSVKRLYT
jgi:alanine racemase